MPTRTSHRWNSLPGNFDRLHVGHTFSSDNTFGIPLLQLETWVPTYLQPYGTRVRAKDVPEGGAMHFFLDDFRFEVVWNRPQGTLVAPGKLGRALTPDFSFYDDWPRVLQIYNTYRNRWMGCYWQENGISVIPSVCWGALDTWDFCFAGIPAGGTVAVSVVGVRRDGAEEFILGYQEMVRRLAPAHVVVYGTKLPEVVHDLVAYTLFPTRWQSIHTVKSSLERKELAL